MDNPSLVAMFGAKAKLAGQVERQAFAMERYGKIPTYFGAFYKPIGMEFEIENIGPAPSGLVVYRDSVYWKYTKDNSLRNNGVEFVSVPVSGHSIDYALYELETELGIRYPDHMDSIRTSIHVHVDVSEWSLRELFALPTLYALFEDVFFSFHNEARQNNPYCYPITSLAPNGLSVYTEAKYCALNLAPAQTQLSVEFRHANFDRDMKKNRRWIQIVCKFMKYAEEHRSELVEIVKRTVIQDDYLKLFNVVLGKSAQFFDEELVYGMMKNNAPWAIAVTEVL